MMWDSVKSILINWIFPKSDLEIVLFKLTDWLNDIQSVVSFSGKSIPE